MSCEFIITTIKNCPPNNNTNTINTRNSPPLVITTTTSHSLYPSLCYHSWIDRSSSRPVSIHMWNNTPLCHPCPWINLTKLSVASASSAYYVEGNCTSYESICMCLNYVDVPLYTQISYCNLSLPLLPVYTPLNLSIFHFYIYISTLLHNAKLSYILFYFSTASSLLYTLLVLRTSSLFIHIFIYMHTSFNLPISHFSIYIHILKLFYILFFYAYLHPSTHILTFQ